MKSKPIVYIAGPYTKGDSGINVHCHMDTFNRLMNDGLVIPFAPLLSHFQHIAFPRPYKDWIEYDFAILKRMDACLRLKIVPPHIKRIGYKQPESSGADNEEAFCKENNIPVFYDRKSLYKWVETK